LIWLSLLSAYVVAILGAGGIAALRFQSLRVGSLATAGIAAVHLTYAIAVLLGLRARPVE
jgi:hypothetical protein